MENKNKKRVSVDFDGTLTREDVQQVVRNLIKEGHEVFVVTARWPDPLIFRWVDAPTNYDMYQVLDSVGISRTNVIFTNAGTKADLLVQAKVDVFLDDNKDQLFWARLAGIKSVDVTMTSWATQLHEIVKAPKHSLKLLICGEGRHGKDTVADLLTHFAGLTSTSSSWVAADLFFEANKEKYGYKTLEECYEDRVNHRAEWFTFITQYNSPDRTKLTRKILETSNIYVGLRNPEELEASRHLFDITLYVDASKRVAAEGKDSNGITKEMCDFVIENNGTYEELVTKVEKLARVLCLNPDKQ